MGGGRGVNSVPSMNTTATPYGPTAAEDRLVPVSVGGAYVVPISGWTAALVLVVWAAVSLVAGAWQTARRDA
jgi:hypothetical protein